MKKVFAIVIVVVLTAAVAVVLSASFSGRAQIKKIERPDLKKVPRICLKADLAQWKDNLPLGPQGEFPYEGPCKNCWEQLGAMRLPTMSVWIQNKGQADAPASKAQLAWRSAKPPYEVKTVRVDVPALAKGEEYLLRITPPSGSFFQIARQVQVTLDAAKQVAECNEGNNILTYKY